MTHVERPGGCGFFAARLEERGPCGYDGRTDGLHTLPRDEVVRRLAGNVVVAGPECNRDVSL